MNECDGYLLAIKKRIRMGRRNIAPSYVQTHPAPCSDAWKDKYFFMFVLSSYIRNKPIKSKKFRGWGWKQLSKTFSLQLRWSSDGLICMNSKKIQDESIYINRKTNWTISLEEKKRIQFASVNFCFSAID
jgi:hypothetical protein